VEIMPADEARAVALLASDVDVTLGVGHESLIREVASMRREFFNEPDTIDVTPDEYVERVVEEVQQYFQDCFVDTTWPECPFHHRHPLWLHDGYWTCEQLRAPVARIGELRASGDSRGRYVILADRGRAPEQPGR
jgi:hypothetical protein